MLRPFYKISIQQIPTPKWTDRNLNFILDFPVEYEIETGWEKHTDSCTLKFPKNINLYGNNQAVFAYGGTYNLISGGSGTENSPNIDAFGAARIYSPLIMKGDIITINCGYLFRNESDSDNQCFTGGSAGAIAINDVPINSDLSTTNNLFFGYISSIGSDTPIEIKCEDNFYLLKRTPFPKSVWNEKESSTVGETTSLYGLMRYILSLVNKQFSGNQLYNSINGFSSTTGLANVSNPYPVLTLLDIPDSITAQFSLGYLEIGSLTCGQVLDKLKQQYHFESTFRGNVLQFGFPIYIDSDSNYPNLNANSNNFFCFEDIYNSSGALVASANIFPSHDLEYSNKDDIVLSATVQCKVISNLGKSTLSGTQKTKVEKLKVFVYWDIPTNTFKSINLSTGSEDGTKVPLNPDGGERHEFYYPVDKSNPNPTIQQLTDLGIQQLYKYHYTGFRGCFTTFGTPYVQWNDNVNLLSSIYSDRNAQYKVKKVKYRGGMKGLSQEIHLDYRIDVPISKNVKSVTVF